MLSLFTNVLTSSNRGEDITDQAHYRSTMGRLTSSFRYRRQPQFMTRPRRAAALKGIPISLMLHARRSARTRSVLYKLLDSDLCTLNAFAAYCQSVLRMCSPTGKMGKTPRTQQDDQGHAVPEPGPPKRGMPYSELNAFLPLVSVQNLRKDDMGSGGRFH
jgi:hypothetical protein